MPNKFIFAIAFDVSIFLVIQPLIDISTRHIFKGAYLSGLQQHSHHITPENPGIKIII